MPGTPAGVRERNESAWLLPNDGSRTNHQLRAGMRRFADEDEIDLVIVGCGAGGSVLLQRLARAGWRVAALDAGPFWDPDRDWVSDEAGSHHLYWTEPRVITGTDPVPMGSNNSGRGVGGSMVHYAGYTPRFHPSDFMTQTADGVGADWPISYPELRPWYEQIEQELPVAGDHWPWGDPHGYPHRPHPVGGNGEIFQRGARKAGVEARVGPVAITNGRFGNRPHCIYRGFCLQGCKVNAKASPLITHVPDALAHGAEIRADTMVTRVAIDAETGRALGVHYVKDGKERFQRAAMVAVAGYSIETPRLLLNSACSRFPDGVGNDFDQVGRYLMVQGAPQTAGRFDAEVRMYKAPPPEVSSEQFYETDPTKDYRRGFSIQTVSPLPITWAEHVAAQGHWGGALREYMSDYVHWATLGALCEFLPQPGNRVTLADEKDRLGLPVANFSYSQCDNDRALAQAAQAVMEDILHAAGADEVITIQRYAHLVGGARMARDERHGVVDGFCRSFAVPNLYITDGSVLPTQGAANPALTIMAVAARAADHLAAGAPGREPLMTSDPAIESVETAAYKIPTDAPEGDGTLTWDNTTLVLARVRAGDTEGIGWTYGSAAAAAVIAHELTPVVQGRPALDVPGSSEAMIRAVRNVTRPGVAGYAISAVDIALWDLKAKLLGLPLFRLLGAVRDEVPVYGSGGFTPYGDEQLRSQLTGWAVEQRIPRVKIKIGESWGGDVARDLARMRQAREVVGDDAELYVDANGGYGRKQAIRVMDAAAADGLDVRWFEEPVSSDDLDGLREVRDAVTPDVAAGEYGWDLYYFRRMCAAGAVDCLQADASRCGGITEWLRAGAVAASFGLELSGHCAPHLHAHAAAAVPNFRHLEWFHDHVRIESMFFDGTLDPTGGTIRPAPDRPGLGLEFRTADAEPYRVR